MASCTIFTALTKVGLHITLILPVILSDPKTGMVRDGLRGMRGGLNTGRVFSGSILIGVNTGIPSIMVRNFMNNTIVARAVGGRKDSNAAPLLHPVPKGANEVRLKGSPLKASSMLCSTNNSNSSTSRRSSSNIKMRVRTKKNRKITNNSKGWNLVDVVPVRTCRSQIDRKGATLIT